MQDILADLLKILQQSWWTGIAGLAQITAAILALITIVQARSMMQNAERARQEALSPILELTAKETEIYYDPVFEYCADCTIGVLNIGHGAAKDFRVYFESSNGVEPMVISLDSSLGTIIREGERVNILLKWQLKAPPAGFIITESRNVLGTILKQKLRLSTYVGRHDNKRIYPIGDFDVELHENITQSWWRKLLRRKDQGPQAIVSIPAEKYSLMRKWILDTFELEGTNIIIERRSNGNSSVEIAGFLSMFGGCSVPPTVSEMKNAVTEKSGWYRTIELWANKGLIIDDVGIDEKIGDISYAREKEIIKDLYNIINSFEPTEKEPFLTMFVLISRYNQTGRNRELIGGDWARQHGIDLPS